MEIKVLPLPKVALERGKSYKVDFNRAWIVFWGITTDARYTKQRNNVYLVITMRYWL